MWKAYDRLYHLDDPWFRMARIVSTIYRCHGADVDPIDVYPGMEEEVKRRNRAKSRAALAMKAAQTKRREENG